MESLDSGEREDSPQHEAEQELEEEIGGSRRRLGERAMEEFGDIGEEGGRQAIQKSPEYAPFGIGIVKKVLKKTKTGKSKWFYRRAWHDKRATKLFGKGKGRRIATREYDKFYKGKDIEYKSTNFTKGTADDELLRIEQQIEKDVQNLRRGIADPHWHFEHDPRTDSNMAPLLKMLDDGGIPWTFGNEPPF